MRLLLLLLIVVALPATTIAAPRLPAKGDKCPVCGMFVAKYPNFASQIQFKDGSTAHFDGAKDMFAFYLAPARYLPGKKQGDVTAVYVTDYYSLKAVDAFSAFYVIGSNVFGPMGKELVPLATKEDASEFRKDHQGTKVMRFSDVVPAVLDSLK